MTIQPLVENAIKHGISKLEGVGTIRVNVALAGDLLCVEVSDNGPGFPRGFSIGNGGHGLQNIADRLAGYYGGGAQLTWENATVFLKIPRRSAPDLVKSNGNHAYSDRG
jgi:sensor histidine kinase YesM